MEDGVDDAEDEWNEPLSSMLKVVSSNYLDVLDF